MTALRILLVEDDAKLRAALAETLEGLGHQVSATAATEREAVAAADRCMPDLMIVDMELALGSGVAAVAHIIRNGHVPHVYMTSVLSNDLFDGAPVLRKPFHAADLVASIEKALKRLKPELHAAHE